MKTNTTARRITRAIPIVSMLAFSSACSSPNARSLADSGAPPAASPDAGAGSAGDAGPQGPDGGGGERDAAASPDDGAVRRLVDRGLFGEMPIENHVMDPEFDLATDNWYALAAGGQSLATIHKRYETETPTGQATLLVPKGGANVGQVFVSGTAESSGGPMTASIWIARRSGEWTSSVTVSLLTVNPAGAAVGIDLAIDPMTPEKAIGDLVWKRYTAMVRDPAVGWMHFFISDATADPFSITGPTVVSARASRLRALDGAPAWRPARALEKAALEAFSKRTRERFRAGR
jgi:hypothetical protein